MSEIVYLDHLRTDGEALIAAVAASPAAAVPSCPGWDLTALAGHVGMVWALVTHTVDTRPTGFEMPPEATIPDGDTAAVVAWLNERFTRLIASLAVAGTATPMWTWGEPQHSGFFHRRMAMETAVHLVDAQLAARGDATAVARELAVDGIDEVIEIGWRHQHGEPTTPPPSTSLHLHCTDGHGEWLIRSAGGDIVVTHEHAKGDAAVRGSASDLFLYLWRRPTAAPVEILGDAATAAAWVSLTP